MEAIKPLWEQGMPLDPLRSKEEKAEGGRLFTDVFQTAVDSVRETDYEVSEMEYLMATGQLDNPAQLLIAQTKATSAVSLLMDLRNKAMEAYNELMRISL